MKNELKELMSQYVADCKQQSKIIAEDKKDARSDVSPTFEGFMKWLDVKDAPDPFVPDLSAAKMPETVRYDDEEYWHDGKKVTAQKWSEITGIEIVSADKRPSEDQQTEETEQSSSNN